MGSEDGGEDGFGFVEGQGGPRQESLEESPVRMIILGVFFVLVRHIRCAVREVT